MSEKAGRHRRNQHLEFIYIIALLVELIAYSGLLLLIQYMELDILLCKDLLLVYVVDIDNNRRLF